ncbi:MAG: SDR family oxidoreductase [Candidatus Acidiferrales bacterium]|jgi:NAD(P)-dependent dehydrogenase (short-subunit alcohol dehydrogenase family)
MAQPQNMTGKTCIVTGANSGIGKETALALARMGARVVLVCRNPEKGRAALEEIRRESGSSELDLLIADMSSQASVRALAEQIRQKYSRLDVLINNAGGGVPAPALSADGIEMVLATNHLGAALLTLLLLDLLKASAPSRIINVSSEAQRRARLDMNDLQFEKRKYSGLAAYGQSKLLMNAFTFELARRLEGTGVTANCLHPGVVATNIWGANPPLLLKLIIAVVKPFMLNSKEGAEVSLYLATSPEVAQTSGQYFVKSKPAESSPLSRDPKVASEIWQWTQKMIGVNLA